MSIIAKSLKKQKQNENKRGSSKKLKHNSININVFFIFFIVIMIVFCVSYILIQDKKTSNTTNLTLPKLDKLKIQYNNEVKKLSVNKEKTISERLNFYLSANKYNELFELAKTNNNKKFIGIYYFLEGNYNASEKFLREFISSSGVDTTSGTYLANIYFNKKQYSKALSILNSLDNSGKVLYDKAVTYEKLNNYKNALTNYKESLKYIKDPLMRYRIKVKIFVLKQMLQGNIS